MNSYTITDDKQIDDAREIFSGLSAMSDVLEEMDAVAEGITTARSVNDMGLQHDIDMPITREVYRVLFDGRSPEQATQHLMLRPPKGE